MASFRWVETTAGPALVCRDLEPYARHFFTTRPWALGSRSRGQTDDDRWAQVADAVQATPRIARLRQVHGRDVVIAGASAEHLPEGDILITDTPLLAIAVQVADCVPLLIVDRKTGVIAAAHAGWRGMAAGVPGAAVDALTKQYGSRPCDLLAALGPSIGACCYEVGSDVRNAFIAAGAAADRFDAWFRDEPLSSPVNPSMRQSGFKTPVEGPPSAFAEAPAESRIAGGDWSGGLRPAEAGGHSLVNGSRDRRAAHWFFDGWACVREQLQTAGVPDGQIFSAGLCTASHPDLFCSYRRDGATAGRMAGVVMGAPRPRRPSPG